MSETVVFDFDKTLTYKDTLLDFFVVCGKRRKLFLAHLGCYWMLAVFSKLGLISNHQLKDWGVRTFLAGLSRVEVGDLGRRYAADITLNKVYFEHFLKRFPNAYVVSASFPEYLQHLFDQKRLLASTIRYEGGKPVGLQMNCYRGAKARMLKGMGIARIDTLYTDSRSDLPLAEMASRIYLVRGDNVIECDSLADFRRKAGGIGI